MVEKCSGVSEEKLDHKVDMGDCPVIRARRPKATNPTTILEGKGLRFQW